ncbi:MAG TPA: hypothetical protein VN256_06160 [Pyrinomonadaceae bacterium]|nr:hypothetical protein [Pyrinomonadaceae bacterium]
MTGARFIGMYPFQWIALLVAAMTLLLLADALAGHYRSGFAFRSQYAPFVSGGLLIIWALAASIAPDVSWANKVLRVAGWLAVVTGAVGFGFHHYYGIVKKPGGYGWLLHYLMYGAPQLAPLALTATGALALIAAQGLAKQTTFGGINIRAAIFVFLAVTLVGAVLQAGILHYRGAFNNPMMFVPLTAPLVAIIISIWMAFTPGRGASVALAVLLWLTFLTGFVGLGMHLRGLGRQMGGLYVIVFNWLEGPPAFAPALFAGLSAVGLVAIHLL